MLEFVVTLCGTLRNLLLKFITFRLLPESMFCKFLNYLLFDRKITNHIFIGTIILNLYVFLQQRVKPKIKNRLQIHEIYIQNMKLKAYKHHK